MRIVIPAVAAPQGSKRHVGRGILVEQCKRVAPYRKQVATATAIAMQGKPPIEGPLQVNVLFEFERPKSHPKGSQPITRSSGDIDKLLRSTFDGLQTGGAFLDDSQIVLVTAAKHYGSSPGVTVDIFTYEPPF